MELGERKLLHFKLGEFSNFKLLALDQRGGGLVLTKATLQRMCQGSCRTVIETQASATETEPLIES